MSKISTTQSGVAQLRGYYFQHTPELVAHLFSVPLAERLHLQGIGGGRWQRFMTRKRAAALLLDGQ